MITFTQKDILEKSELRDFNESFDLARYTSSIVDEKDGREIIIHILDI